MVELSQTGEQKKFAAQKGIQLVGLFIMMLVFTLPFYSANAMAASVHVTKNYGNDQIEGFIDAQNDVWQLEVEVTPDQGMEVSPEQVILQVGSSQTPFTSCSSSSLTSTCEFQSVLSNGIPEDTYLFEVVLYDLETDSADENSTTLGSEIASDTSSVVADGSGPSISFTDVYQEASDIYLEFTVEDRPASCVGLETIEVLDAESGSVHETFQVQEQGDCSFDYVTDGETGGVLSTSLEGEERRHFRIRATDRFGHESLSSSQSIDTDFVAPQVQASTLFIPSFGQYVGSFIQSSDVLVNVTECSGLQTVSATSDTIAFLSQDATCELIDAVSCTNECYWSDLSINPSGSSLSATITATDVTGNSQTSTISSSFTSDNSAPSVVSFGTLASFDEISYVGAGEDATIYAFIDETGAGIETDSVIANLAGVGGSSEDRPDECVRDNTGFADYVCHWDVTVDGIEEATTATEINIHYLRDNVGNSGDPVTVPVIIDGVAPDVLSVEMYGFSAIGQKDYFQSNDDVIVEMEIQEASGLLVYVDANDIVMDAENEYRYGTYDDNGDYVASELDGWVAFDEESCVRHSETGNWLCEFQVESIKSGPDSAAEIGIQVMDTARNDARWEDGFEPVNSVTTGFGEFEIEIFALDQETQPDFWEQRSTTTSSFVDLDTAALTNPRIMFSARLGSSINARSGLIELAECAALDGGPALSRSLLFGGNYPEPNANPVPNIILEFESFEADSVLEFADMSGDTFEQVELEYACILHIYSVVDDTAYTYAESQEITLNVPFAYSGEGTLDENVDAYLRGIAENTEFKILDSIKILNTVLKWINYLKPVYSILLTLIEFVQGLAQQQDGQLRNTPQGIGIATALCKVEVGTVSGAASEVNKVVGPVLDVITCNPSSQVISNSWYGQWQKGVIDVFNVVNYAGIPGAGSVSLYDNIWISIAGLCVPGIVHNLEKLRQTYCYEAKCLMQDVPAGIATVNSCQKAFDVLQCKYWKGEIVAFVMPTGLPEFLKNTIKSVLTNPLGLITFAVNLGCAIGMCQVPQGGGNAAVVCSKIAYVFDLLDIASNIANLVQGYPALQYDLCEEIGFDQNYGQSDGADAESVTTEDVTAGSEGAEV